jgi:hypothetical protein
MRVLGGMAVVVSVLLGLALWLVVKETTEKKIAVELAFVFLMIVLVAVVSVATACTVAKVEDGRLDFFFCGIRTRTFALDGGTTFDLHKIGRMEVLRIQRGHRTYVPNGALDKHAIVDLLRTNDVAKREAD